jgi:GxxExxY protein
MAGQNKGEFDMLSRRVIGAAIEVHRRLGPGFGEELYERALCIELEKRGIRCDRQVVIPVYYDGIEIGRHRLDLIVEGQLIIELKAVSAIADVHSAQLLGYLRATNLQVGLVLNFGDMPLGVKRIVNQYKP